MNLTRVLPLSQAEQGSTLIELLVSIALGLLILLGVGALYLGANQSTRVATNTASTEEAGQVILAAIGNAVRRAGYAEIMGAGGIIPSRQDLLYSGPYLQACKGAEFVLDKDGNPVIEANGNFECGASTAGDPDSLAVVFQGDNVIASAQGATRDCLGQDAPSVDIPNPDYAMRVSSGTLPLVRNIYYLDAGNLMCRGNGGPTPAALTGNIEDFKVYFGFDDAAFADPIAKLGNPVASSILDAAQIRAKTSTNPTFSAWDAVITVQVCVLVATADMGVTAQEGAATHIPCPQSAKEAAGIDPITAETSPTDGRVRRAYSQVFTVRSRAKPAPLG